MELLQLPIFPFFLEFTLKFTNVFIYALDLHFCVTTFPFVLAQENKDYKEFNDKD